MPFYYIFMINKKQSNDKLISNYAWYLNSLLKQYVFTNKTIGGNTYNVFNEECYPLAECLFDILHKDLLKADVDGILNVKKPLIQKKDSMLTLTINEKLCHIRKTGRPLSGIRCISLSKITQMYEALISFSLVIIANNNTINFDLLRDLTKDIVDIDITDNELNMFYNSWSKTIEALSSIKVIKEIESCFLDKIELKNYSTLHPYLYTTSGIDIALINLLYSNLSKTPKNDINPSDFYFIVNDESLKREIYNKLNISNIKTYTDNHNSLFYANKLIGVSLKKQNNINNIHASIISSKPLFNLGKTHNFIFDTKNIHNSTCVQFNLVKAKSNGGDTTYIILNGSNIGKHLINESSIASQAKLIIRKSTSSTKKSTIEVMVNDTTTKALFGKGASSMRKFFKKFDYIYQTSKSKDLIEELSDYQDGVIYLKDNLTKNNLVNSESLHFALCVLKAAKEHVNKDITLQQSMLLNLMRVLAMSCKYKLIVDGIEDESTTDIVDYIKVF